MPKKTTRKSTSPRAKATRSTARKQTSRTKATATRVKKTTRPSAVKRAKKTTRSSVAKRVKKTTRSAVSAKAARQRVTQKFNYASSIRATYQALAQEVKTTLNEHKLVTTKLTTQLSKQKIKAKAAEKKITAYQKKTTASGKSQLKRVQAAVKAFAKDRASIEKEIAVRRSAIAHFKTVLRDLSWESAQLTQLRKARQIELAAKAALITSTKPTAVKAAAAKRSAVEVKRTKTVAEPIVQSESTQEAIGAITKTPAVKAEEEEDTFSEEFNSLMDETE